MEPTPADYRRLLTLRTALRRFLDWSATQARASGLTPSQHQLLLAVRGHPDPAGPTVGEVADYLVIRHHSAVGLIDRAQAAGLVLRRADSERRGTVHVTLTPAGAGHLERLSALSLAELERLGPSIAALFAAHGPDPGAATPDPGAAHGPDPGAATPDTP